MISSASLVLSHLLAAAAGAKLSSSEGEEEASLDPLQRLGEDIRNVARLCKSRANLVQRRPSPARLARTTRCSPARPTPGSCATDTWRDTTRTRKPGEQI